MDDAPRDPVLIPLRAAITGRRAFFALPDPANGPAPEGGEARKSASGRTTKVQQLRNTADMNVSAMCFGD